MSNQLPLRNAAYDIFHEALRAVDASTAVEKSVRLTESDVIVCDERFALDQIHRIYAIAIGKAALPMAIALEDTVDDLFAEGFIAGPIAGQRSGKIAMPPRKLSTRLRWCEGGHPLPTNASLVAAQSAFSLLERANAEQSLVIFLISGGGSAMFEWPISEDITLANLRTANRALISCGASISEVNAVRRAFSAVKGGRLSSFAPKSRQLTLIVSDVPNGEEHNVASGPTLPPPADSSSAREVVARYELAKQLPFSIMRAIEEAPSAFNDSRGDRHKHFVVLNNDMALDAAAKAARERGFITEIARDITDNPIAVGCEKLLARLDDLQRRNPDAEVCIISGGEFACPVRGDGVGGRNSETALRLAMTVDKDRYGEFVALCAGTDGIDGNSTAAGAIADGRTMGRARAMFREPSHFLDNSDSASLFIALEDAIETGLTGTNVRDLRVLLSTPHK